jgi:hypothetical protein
MTKHCEHGLTYEEQCVRCNITWHQFLLNTHRLSAGREERELAKWQTALDAQNGKRPAVALRRI